MHSKKKIDDLTDSESRETPDGASDPVTKQKMVFHEEYASFTKQLRKLMKENPLLPVVIFDRAEPNGVELVCEVAYVHGEDGEFREKIIAVYNKKKTMDDTDDDDCTELPF